MNNKYILTMKEKIYTMLNHAKTPLAYKSSKDRGDIHGQGEILPPPPQKAIQTLPTKNGTSWGTPH
jgi:hypothetical protein